MPATMAAPQRPRISFDIDEVYKRAFVARAGIEGLSQQEMFMKMVELCCAEDLERAREMLRDAGKPKKGKGE